MAQEGLTHVREAFVPPGNVPHEVLGSPYITVISGFFYVTINF